MAPTKFSTVRVNSHIHGILKSTFDTSNSPKSISVENKAE